MPTSERMQREAAIGMGGRIAVAQRNRSVIGGERLFKAAHVMERGAAIDQRLGAVRLERERAYS